MLQSQQQAHETQYADINALNVGHIYATQTHGSSAYARPRLPLQVCFIITVAAETQTD